MLARLQESDGVDHAAVDRGGDLLRLTLRHSDPADAIALLRELGYDAEIASDDEATTTALWYDAASVGELSRVEARVIAERIVPPLARERDLTAAEAAEVERVVVSVLHRYFTERALRAGATPGGFRQDCVLAIAAAADPVIGAGAARALAERLDIDLGQDHRRGR
ncbi:MAG TPA: hypothetical protein VGS17_12570 [Candidatus Limnocylindria bacterium]|nr:hypothetical protein [Candidatus Limnocylindria bacterium]